MTTQSQLVDEMVAETLRPDLLMTIASFANQVIRELHQEPQGKTAIGFSDNLNEAQIYSNSEAGFLWTIPRPHLFQRMALVVYDRWNKPIPERKPSSMFGYEAMVGGDRFWYRVGLEIAFSGYGGTGSGVRLAWYEYPRNLAYKMPDARLVKWDDDAQAFLYKEGLTQPEQVAALAVSTNWVMQRHMELVKQGLRTKIYARLGQYDRARLAYSQYEALRPGMVSAELDSNVGVYIKE